MKKFYTYLSALIIGASSAFAQSGDYAKVESIRSLFGEKVKAEATVTKKGTASSRAAATSIDELCGNWKFSYYGYISGDSGAKSKTITISKSDDAENEVIINGIYSDFQIKGTVDLAAGTLTLEKQFLFTHTQGQVYFYQTYWNAAGNKVLDSEEPMIGTIADGKITFDDMQNIAVGIPGLGWFFLGGSCVWTYTGEKDYTTEIFSSAYCADDDKHTFSLNIGPDCASSKLRIFAMPFNVQMLDLTATGGQTVKSGNYSLNVPSVRTTNTLVVVSLDANGNVIGSDHTEVHFTVTTDDEWESIGNAKYTEVAFAEIYQTPQECTYEVPVQVNKENRSIFRLVDPYGAAWPHYTANAVLDHTHNHYLYVNATNADQVYIEDSPVGINLGGDGDAMISSQAAKYLAWGNTAEDIAAAGFFGKLEGTTVTFPANHITFAEKNYAKGERLAVESANGKIELPEAFAAIDGIGVDEADVNAPVEYFNFQGVRVANPTEGTIVIRRQGSKVSKVLVK
ncbi:MAG: hypothetical protein NC043_09405 [Muribaculaceae bacterium]|nr:hypothetical protein [Muribaculaceae bacterium]